MFKKYQHLERYGTEETSGLLDGLVYIFPKIDGTNASVWFDERLHFGSRNRELDLQNDNAGFMNTNITNENLKGFFDKYPNYRLYGEWLVPHSLKTYHDDAWRKFYIFDVYHNDDLTQALVYEEYKSMIEEFNLDYIPPIVKIKNPTEENLFTALDKCGFFLIQDNKGLGEGIVVKNYDFKNKYGRQTWGKIISNEFKETHHKVMGAPLVNGSKIIEDEIVYKYVTSDFVLKEQAKIVNELGEWKPQYIPRLLGVVYYTLIHEEIWNILKEYKNPKINFTLLNKMTIDKTKKIIL